MKWYKIKNYLGHEETYWCAQYMIAPLILNGVVDHWKAYNFCEDSRNFDTFEDAESWCESDFKRAIERKPFSSPGISGDRISMPPWDELKERITDDKKIDYKGLLERYMAYVADVEGSDFIEVADRRRSYHDDFFHEGDWEELERIADEVWKKIGSGEYFG